MSKSQLCKCKMPDVQDGACLTCKKDAPLGAVRSTKERNGFYRGARKANKCPYAATCQGGTGGKCCDPDCLKCWPDPPSQTALTSAKL